MQRAGGIMTAAGARIAMNADCKSLSSGLAVDFVRGRDSIAHAQRVRAPNRGRRRRALKAYVFRDRQARVIQLVLDDDASQVVAFHRGERVGYAEFETGECETRLFDIFIEPSCRASGIAHTLIGFVCREIGHPLTVDLDQRAVASAFLCMTRHLRAKV
ncbi:GNAT family N-acetyltransferase [Caballeronia sp. ATUFL_M2_KS44]|uniref:GNAT family N-acetyltransferase n=1 Tax=Caballeronia sp. ATUFL_M2_KS44 TaxID=2921767 RepID=UPI00202795A2|nr:GNAT family N-acetyltransferase [Caballeronia sp. ATUFL_M2_KS44]